MRPKGPAARLLCASRVGRSELSDNPLLSINADLLGCSLHFTSGERSISTERAVSLFPRR